MERRGFARNMNAHHWYLTASWSHTVEVPYQHQLGQPFRRLGEQHQSPLRKLMRTLDGRGRGRGRERAYGSLLSWYNFLSNGRCAYIRGSITWPTFPQSSVNWCCHIIHVMFADYESETEGTVVRVNTRVLTFGIIRVLTINKTVISRVKVGFRGACDLWICEYIQSINWARHHCEFGPQVIGTVPCQLTTCCGHKNCLVKWDRTSL